MARGAGNKHGGARPGAGKKPPQNTVEFRARIRARLCDPEQAEAIIDLAFSLARDVERPNTSLLQELIRQAIGMPSQAIALTGANGGPVRYVAELAPSGDAGPTGAALLPAADDPGSGS